MKRPVLFGIMLSGLAVWAASTRGQSISFAPAATYAAGAGRAAYDLVVADANGDGKPDLLAVNGSSDAVSVLLGTGSGTFQPFSTYNTGGSSNPQALAVGDLNKDGKLDLLTANFSTSTVSVLLGSGNGAFANTATYAAGSGPYAVAVADVNGDGKLDVLTANRDTGTASVLLGNGNGTLQAATAFSVGLGSQPTGLAIADVNGDAKPDLLVTNSTTAASTVGVLLGVGNGTFQLVVSYAAGASSFPRRLAVADVNGDGMPDLLTANTNSNTAGVLPGIGNGTFQPVATYPTGTSSFPFGIVAADVTGDGRPDLLTANYSTGAVGVLAGNGNGTFQPAVEFSVGPGNYPFMLASADINNDGRLDILTINQGSTASVLLNTTPLAARAALPGASAALFPNPATTAATLTLTGLPAAVAQVQATLLNATGRAVARHTLAASQGSARAEVPTSALAAGFYVLRLDALDAQGQPAGSLPAQRLSVH